MLPDAVGGRCHGRLCYLVLVGNMSYVNVLPDVDAENVRHVCVT